MIRKGKCVEVVAQVVGCRLPVGLPERRALERR